MYEMTASNTQSENHLLVRMAETARVVLASVIAVASFLALAIFLAAGTPSRTASALGAEPTPIPIEITRTDELPQDTRPMAFETERAPSGS